MYKTKHQNIVKLHKVYYGHDQVYLILEYCPKNLQALIDEKNEDFTQGSGLNHPENIQKVILQICKGL